MATSAKEVQFILLIWTESPSYFVQLVPTVTKTTCQQVTQMHLVQLNFRVPSTTTTQSKANQHVCLVKQDFPANDRQSYNLTLVHRAHTAQLMIQALELTTWFHVQLALIALTTISRQLTSVTTALPVNTAKLSLLNSQGIAMRDTSALVVNQFQILQERFPLVRMITAYQDHAQLAITVLWELPILYLVQLVITKTTQARNSVNNAMPASTARQL